MSHTAPLIRCGRRLLSVAWVVALAGLVGLALWSRVSEPVIVGGRSMEPAVALGSLIAPQRVAAPEIRVGDVITVLADNGVLVTHRVTRIVDIADGRFFELRGDGNPGPDPMLVPARSLIGRADVVLPFAGFVLAALMSPIGLISVLGLLGALLFAIWLLEDLEAGSVGLIGDDAPAAGARHGASGAPG
ncbi:MAG: signal peptidase I [Chloroflexota bacterium]|nr:signal peptidase I [Chloroflexota bacterium]